MPTPGVDQGPSDDEGDTEYEVRGAAEDGADALDQALRARDAPLRVVLELRQDLEVFLGGRRQVHAHGTARRVNWFAAGRGSDRRATGTAGARPVSTRPWRWPPSPSGEVPWRAERSFPSR